MNSMLNRSVAFAPARPGREAPPEGPVSGCGRARKLMRLYDFDGYLEAVTAFQHVLEQAPGYAPAFAGLGETYSYWGFRRELNGLEARSYYHLAVENAELALDLAPERGESHRAMSVALRRGDRIDAERSKEEVLLALDLDANDAETWCQYWRAFGYNIADTSILRAIELDPTLCGAYNDLAVVLCGCGRFDEAARHLETALRLSPSNSLVQYNLAMVLDRRNQREAALRLLQSALAARPGDALLTSGWALMGGTHHA